MTERTVYAVVYGNYYPREVHSLYESEAEAQAKADELNGTKETAWDVEEMTVSVSPDVSSDES